MGLSKQARMSLMWLTSQPTSWLRLLAGSTARSSADPGRLSPVDEDEDEDEDEVEDEPDEAGSPLVA